MPPSSLAAPIPSTSHVAHGVSGEQRLREWRATLSCLFDVEVGCPDALAGFSAELQGYDFRRLVLVRLRGSRQILRRSMLALARSRPDCHVVLVQRSGAMRVVTGERTVEVGTGDLLMLDLGQVAELQLAKCDVAALIVPHEALPWRGEQARALHGLVLPASTSSVELFGTHLDHLVAEAPNLDAAEASWLAAGCLVLITSLIGQAVEGGPGDGAGSRRAVVEMRQFIARELASPKLGANELAKRFNLSRATLYRAFEAHGGVASYIRLRRLEKICQEIVSPTHAHRRIGDIAYEWGFRNEANFSRSFKKVFGLSARNMRARAASRDDKHLISAAGRALSTWIWDLSEPSQGADTRLPGAKKA